MSAPAVASGTRSGLWQVWLLLGLGLLAVAWLLPVNVKSLNTALLREAGRDTPTVAAFGRDLLGLDKPGPAALVLEAARQTGDSGANALGVIFDSFAAKHRDMMPWGGWDVALEPLLINRNAASSAESQPVLKFMVTQQARDNLRHYLAVSRLPAVQTLLKTGELTTTQRFVPAGRPGGQPLDAVILLTAYLWQTEHLSASLQREVRAPWPRTPGRAGRWATSRIFTSISSRLGNGSTGSSFPSCCAPPAASAPSGNSRTSHVSPPSTCRSSTPRR